MCGRYTFFTDKKVSEIGDIIEKVSNDTQYEKMKTGEIFPSDAVPILLQDEEGTILPRLAKWGFPNLGNKGLIINARSETVCQKPMFRNALENRRCVIPSTGFYEWDKRKNKFLFNLTGTPLLYMAGLYSIFDGENRFVLLTTDANSSVSEIHDRMPVVLASSAVRDWIKDSGATYDILFGKHPDLIKALSIPAQGVQIGLL